MNFDAFFSLLAPRPKEEFEAIRMALWLISQPHSRSHSDHLEHPRRVAEQLMNHGRQETNILILALLHNIFDGVAIQEGLVRSIAADVSTWRDLEALSRQHLVHDREIGSIQGGSKKDPEEYFGHIHDREPCRWVTIVDRLDHFATASGHWDVERLAKYVLETEKYVVPLAEETDLTLLRELEDAIRTLKDTKLIYLKP